MRTPARLALTCLSAALYGAAFPPLSLDVLAWIALTPLLLALREAPPAVGAALGAVWGVLAAEATGTWFVQGVASYYDRPLVVGLLFFAGVSLVLAAPFFAAFGSAYAWATRRRSRVPAVLWVPMLWVGLELARARFWVGNPWALLGYSQIEHLLMIQIADTTGVYGLSFILAATATAAAELLVRGAGRRRRLGPALTAVLLVALVAGYGAWRLAQPPETGRPLAVAVVQGNVDVGTQWRRALYGANLATYLRLSQEVLARDRPALVVWPESAITFVLDEEPTYQVAIGHLFRTAGAHLVLGGPAVDGRGSTPRYRNAAYLLAPDGAVLDRYDKVHLVPFAEYFPWAALEPLRRRFARVRVFTPGAALRPFTQPHAIGTVICFEAMYPELVSALARQGAALLVNLTNDAWMGRTSFARQHLQIATLRAVETRRYLIRAAATGISAVIDPRGRTVAEIPLRTAGTAAVDVRLLDGVTRYARYGDVFALVCLVGAVVALGTARRRRAP